MKRRIIFFLAILASLGAAAQLRIGGFDGVSLNRYVIDTQYQYDWRYGKTLSVYQGFSLQYDFCDWMGLRTDICPYAEKGYWKYRTGAFDKFSYDIDNRYFQVPVFAVFSFGGTRLRGHFGAGAFGAYWLFSSRHGTVEDPVDPAVSVDFSEDMVFDDTRDRRLEAGMAAVTGIGYRFPANVFVQLEGSIYHGLTSTTKDYMLISDPRYNTLTTVQVCVYYCF